MTKYRNWSQKVTVVEFPSVNGMERATARVAIVQRFTADARDKFFDNVRRILVG